MVYPFFLQIFCAQVPKGTSEIIAIKPRTILHRVFRDKKLKINNTLGHLVSFLQFCVGSASVQSHSEFRS